MKTIFKEKRLEEFVNRAYLCACKHGFHEEDRSYEHWLMLVCSEIGEAVEADRSGRFHFSMGLHPELDTVEEWRTIEHCKDYEVSNLGRVRSKDMKVWNGKSFYVKKGRILKAGLGGTGYYTVCLRGKTHKIAVLVAEAFLKRNNPRDVVNHIDGDKTNDNVRNLEWVSYSDNNRHAYVTGLKKPSQNKLSYEDKVYIAFEHKKGRAYTSILKDKDFGVTKSAIQRICNESKRYTDSIEFELADVCIRLFDLCGLLNVVPEVKHLDKDLMIKVVNGESFCENCYELVRICCMCGDFDEDDVAKMTGVALIFIEVMCKKEGIDLLRHIEWKMRYNESRPKKHGKQY